MEKVKMDLCGAKILLVDDTATNLDVLCELLGGSKLSVAPNGEVALRIADRVMPDLILLDVMMPGIDGFEVCRRLKQNEKTRGIPVIFITAEDMTESVVTGFEVGGVDYIKKPFQHEEVLVRVQTHLEIDRLTRELARKNTQLSQANRQIRQASDRKSSFLANMAHELRTPINAIKGFTGIVLKRGGDRLSDLQQDNLGKVTQSADTLLDLINDLLDLSKIEAGQMDINPDRFSVENLIAACCAEVTPLVKPDVKLDHQVAPDLGQVHTDRGRVRQILINLLSNAVKYTESGAITVRAVKDDDALVLSVSDTGSGIPADALETIFEEFQQVKGTDPHHKGTGLGLSITKGFVELLGGSICVESEVGKGSTFTVRVPVVYREVGKENNP
jgi:signal transduction histidine kinase